jgi:2-polyprenyl-3-methyl-5-hydroxy-6-metoxy-1,4-benzoquinol methylase
MMKQFKQEYFKHRLWEKTPKAIVDAVVLEIEQLAQKELGKPLSKLSILDVGSGAGEYAIALSKKAKKVVGVEPFVDAYNRSTKNKQIAKANVTFINDAIENVKIKNKFDIVLSLTTIEHMPRALTSYRKIFSLLNKGGILYLTGPNKLWPYEYHYRLYFLSWLPLPVANLYVKITGRGTSYEDSAYSRTYFGMKSLFDSFKCTYVFKLPYNLNSAYIGCGSNNRSYTMIKNIGLQLIKRYSIFWFFSKGFIMVIKKR